MLAALAAISVHLQRSCKVLDHITPIRPYFMTIIVTSQGGRTTKLQPTHVDREDVLQRYIHEHPECLPLEEVGEDLRLCVLCREFPTSSGPIDALGVDQFGDIYIIETKLFKNPDKRTVIAQAMDYGSALWHGHDEPRSFLDRIDSLLQQRKSPSIRERLTSFVGDPEGVNDLLNRISANQSAGAFRFVILMDRLTDRLKDLVTFINENSKFTVYAVELEFYRHEGIEIVIPRLYGAEIKKDISSSRGDSARKKWDEQSFFEDATKRLTPREVAAIRLIYERVQEWADEISWGTGVTAGSFSPKKEPEWPRAPFSIYSDGRLVLNFGYFEAGTSVERRADFATSLTKGGIALPRDYEQRHCTIAAADWINRSDALDVAVNSVLHS